MAAPGVPYISFITFTRNDEYAGGLKKLFWGLHYLGEQCDEFGLSAEAVIVEWNPPRERPSLAEALAELPGRKQLTIRIVTVLSSIHRRYQYSHERPMHVGVAANTGLRRSRGMFAVIKVADSFYSDSLVRFLSGRQLSAGRLYRIVRSDVDAISALKLGTSRQEFLAFCDSHVVIRHEQLPQPWMPFRLPDLFSNASGDFQLLAREQWVRLRGYWETTDVTSFETDSMFSYSAHAAGIQEQTLGNDLALYKIQHDASHGTRVTSAQTWVSKKMIVLESRMNRAHYSHAATFWLRAVFDYPPKIYSGRRKPVYERSLIRFKLISSFPQLSYLKNRHWGLAGESLPETVLRRAQWEGE